MIDDMSAAEYAILLGGLMEHLSNLLSGESISWEPSERTMFHHTLLSYARSVNAAPIQIDCTIQCKANHTARINGSFIVDRNASEFYDIEERGMDYNIKFKQILN